MKRLHILPTLFFFAASCAKSPVVDAPPPGGQSGDDGDVKQPGTPAPHSSPPVLQCTTEHTDLGSEDATVFGASAVELLARVAPARSSPLFWVPYDALDIGGFTPGPGQTSLTLQITLLADQPVQQAISAPLPNMRSAGCSSKTVNVPVHVELSTADGALAASFDASLTFSGAGAASLSSEISAESVSGSFSFDSLGKDAPDWALRGFTVDLEVWPSGNRGRVSPTFVSVGPPQPPPFPSPLTSQSAEVPVPAIPDHWSSIAVWPRPETCAFGGQAYAATDLVIGSSLADAVAAFNARAERTLETSDGPVPVHFTLDAPNNLVCATVRTGSNVAFRVPGHLQAVASEASTSLSRLAIRANYDLTVGTGLDGTFNLLHWSGADDGEERADFIAATGLGTDFPDDYAQFWWTWYGTDTRTAATSAWSTQGKFAISALTTQQAAQNASQIAIGGPGIGYGIDEDGNILLPGDILSNADIAP